MAKIRFTIVKTGVTIKDRIRVRRFLMNNIIIREENDFPNLFRREIARKFFGGNKERFENKIDIKLQCPICLKILKDPERPNEEKLQKELLYKKN